MNNIKPILTCKNADSTTSYLFENGTSSSSPECKQSDFKEATGVKMHIAAKEGRSVLLVETTNDPFPKTILFNDHGTASIFMMKLSDSAESLDSLPATAEIKLDVIDTNGILLDLNLPLEVSTALKGVNNEKNLVAKKVEEVEKKVVPNPSPLSIASMRKRKR